MAKEEKAGFGKRLAQVALASSGNFGRNFQREFMPFESDTLALQERRANLDSRQQQTEYFKEQARQNQTRFGQQQEASAITNARQSISQINKERMFDAFRSRGFELTGKRQTAFLNSPLVREMDNVNTFLYLYDKGRNGDNASANAAKKVLGEIGMRVEDRDGNLVLSHMLDPDNVVDFNEDNVMAYIHEQMKEIAGEQAAEMQRAEWNEDFLTQKFNGHVDDIRSIDPRISEQQAQGLLKKLSSEHYESPREMAFASTVIGIDKAIKADDNRDAAQVEEIIEKYGDSLGEFGVYPKGEMAEGQPLKYMEFGVKGGTFAGDKLGVADGDTAYFTLEQIGNELNNQDDLDTTVRRWMAANKPPVDFEGVLKNMKAKDQSTFLAAAKHPMFNKLMDQFFEKYPQFQEMEKGLDEDGFDAQIATGRMMNLPEAHSAFAEFFGNRKDDYVMSESRVVSSEDVPREAPQVNTAEDAFSSLAQPSSDDQIIDTAKTPEGTRAGKKIKADRANQELKKIDSNLLKNATPYIKEAARIADRGLVYAALKWYGEKVGDFTKDAVKEFEGHMKDYERMKALQGGKKSLLDFVKAQYDAFDHAGNRAKERDEARRRR